MTDTMKPLTADEIATWKQLIAQDARLSEQQKLAMERLIATIEQQQEQIEKLHQRTNELEMALERLIRGYGGRNARIAKHRGSATYAAIQILDKNKPSL